MLITHNEQLKDFCNQISSCQVIAVDTEFSRENTYYPKLCLIQVASENHSAAIDPLSSSIDLEPIKKILLSSKITKIFHSSRQDLETLNHFFSILPNNIFDTQLASSLCGFGESISYENLVSKLTGKEIDKSYRISDWSKRPLSEAQLEYAITDVIYLIEIYKFLVTKLNQLNRLSWAEEEMKSLITTNFNVNYESSWKKIKYNKKVKISFVLKNLASWRERKAQLLNLPRNHFLDEKYLLKLAKLRPVSLKELKSISYFENLSENLSEEILSIIHTSLEQELEKDFIENNVKDHGKKSSAFEQLKRLLQQVAGSENIPPNLIATSQEIKAYVFKNYQPRFCQGWRYKIFGFNAEKILSKITQGN